MHRTLTTRFVITIPMLIVILCTGWALIVQQVIPSACSNDQPPANSQYLHCS